MPLDGAAAVTLERLGVGDHDAFLVVHNAALASIAHALVAAARDRAASARALEFPPTGRDGAEPPKDVATAIAGASAVALVTQYSLSHTKARLAATQRGVRVASLPGIDEEMFGRAIPIDYAHLEASGRSLAGQLTRAALCRITAPGGTDVELCLRGRDGHSDDGDLRAARAFGNLPAGEAYIAPVERAGNGVIVFDGSLASWGMLAEPVAVQLQGGRAISIGGGAAGAWLAETLDAGGSTGRVIAELGIGTNPGAAISGRILEDEKVAGTIHVAFGTNTSIGGANQASVHIDGLVREPTVELDGRFVMRAGRPSG